MEQWENRFNKWRMNNYKPKILNSLDKHSEMSKAQFMQRLESVGQEILQENIMRELFREVYKKQEVQKGVIQIDEKDIDKGADKVVELLQYSLDKKL